MNQNKSLIKPQISSIASYNVKFYMRLENPEETLALFKNISPKKDISKKGLLKFLSKIFS